MLVDVARWFRDGLIRALLERGLPRYDNNLNHKVHLKVDPTSGRTLKWTPHPVRLQSDPTWRCVNMSGSAPGARRAR